MSVDQRRVFQRDITLPGIGTILVMLEKNMNWKRRLVERVMALVALFGVMVMVAVLTMEIEGSPYVVGGLGLMGMITVLLIYGIPFDSIKVEVGDMLQLNLQFEDDE